VRSKHSYTTFTFNGPFGTPYLPWTSSGWFTQNPITNIEPLHVINIALYTVSHSVMEAS